MPRPSLSVKGEQSLLVVQGCVSPGLMPRPSLSVLAVLGVTTHPLMRVAGADAPAFVERSSSVRPSRLSPSVAGADAPAFVERRLLTTSLTGKGGQVGGSVYSEPFAKFAVEHDILLANVMFCP